MVSGELHFAHISARRITDDMWFILGGPGSGTSDGDRRYFNPEKYKIVLFDQRAAGKSTPYVTF
jgi:pimeloyl-ACP methyl ester carboxylesterase